MLAGTYEVMVDKTSRVTIPSRHRGRLGTELVICPALPPGQHLLLFDLAGFEAFLARLFPGDALTDDEQDLQRLLVGSAYDAALDKAGRVVLPSVLREFAGLDGPARVVGMQTHLEIWPEAGYQRWYEQANSADSRERAKQVLARLSALGRGRAA